MDKNSIIGIILIAAIFIVWGVVNQPNEEERLNNQRRNDSIADVRAQEAKDREQRLPETTTPSEAKQSSDSMEIAQKAASYGAFSNSLYGENKFYTIENELIKLTVSTKGGRPYSVELKNYQTYDSLPLVLFDGDSTVFNFQFYIQNRTGRIITQDLIFLPADNLSQSSVVAQSPKSISFRSVGSEGKHIEYTYTLSPDSYIVNMDVDMVGMEEDMANTDLSLNWSYYSPMQEKGWKNEAINSTMYYKYFEGDVDNFNARSNKDYQEETVTTPLEWFAYKDQFFSSILMSKVPFEEATMKIEKQPEDGKYIKHFASNIAIVKKPDTPINLEFYFGPNDFKYLKKNFEDRQLHSIVAVGKSIIKFINQHVIINLFNFLNKYISNYGLIILLMTIIIKLFLLPLTFKSYMSQAKMRVVKPMVDEATKKIPKEKAMEKQQATMAIYKKVGVSPLGGCLPMILQMPILFAMFRFFPGSIELRQESFLWATDLSTYDDIIHWSTSIPLLGNHLSLFTLLMTITTIISMKTNSSAQMNDSAMPGMKTMMYIMPVTFLFVLNDFSAALTYYYFLANVITFAQNFLFKRMINEEEVLRKLQAKKAKPKKKSKWQQRIEDMQKAQQQAAKKRK